jgi:hypothetical protein
MTTMYDTINMISCWTLSIIFGFSKHTSVAERPLLKYNVQNISHVYYYPYLKEWMEVFRNSFIPILLLEM